MSLHKLLLAFAVCSMLAAQAAAAAPESAKPNIVSVRGMVDISNRSADRELDLSRVVVYLDSHPQLDSLPSDDQRPVMAQKNKAFVNDLLVVARGTTVEFPNWDPFTHNVFSRSRAAQFDLERYPSGQSKSYRFDQVGKVQLFCNIHPQMRGTIVVVPNRFFAQADKSGRFELSGVPPGQYDLMAWHERCEEVRRTVAVRFAEPAEVSVSLQASVRPAAPQTSPSQRSTAGVERGLGVKRERLNLPVVNEVHAAPRN